MELVSERVVRLCVNFFLCLWCLVDFFFYRLLFELFFYDHWKEGRWESVCDERHLHFPVCIGYRHSNEFLHVALSIYTFLWPSSSRSRSWRWEARITDCDRVSILYSTNLQSVLQIDTLLWSESQSWSFGIVAGFKVITLTLHSLSWDRETDRQTENGWILWKFMLEDRQMMDCKIGGELDSS